MTATKLSILLSISGFLCLSIIDALRKILLVNHSVGVVLLWSSLFSIIMMLGWAVYKKEVRSLAFIPRPVLHLSKSISVALMILSATFAINFMPLSVFYTLIFLAPLVTSVLAKVFLKEHLTLTQAIIIIVGFSGVFIVFTPELNIPAQGILVGLFGVLCFSVNNLINKFFDHASPKGAFGMHPHLIVFSAIVYISVSNRIDFSSFLALTPIEYIYTIIIGFCSVSGLLLHMRAFQIAPASVPAPFQYTQIVWGIVFGFFIFGEVPSLRILAGAAIIASAGFATYFNNQSQEKRKGMPVNPNNYWPHLQSQKKI